MSTEDPRRTFLLEFNRIYRMWARRNLGRKMLYDKAMSGAAKKVTLTDEQMKDVEDYLAGKIEMRRLTNVDSKSFDLEGIS